MAAPLAAPPRLRPVTGAAAPARRPRPGPQPEPARRSPGSRPPLRVVDPNRVTPAVRRRRRRAAVLLAGVIAAGCLFALAAFNAMLVTGQSRIDDLQREVAEAQSQYSANRLAVAELEAPEHVVEVAQRRLGMVPPPGVTYLTPSEAVAAEVAADGARTQDRAAATSTDDADGSASWAAVKPYLGGRR